MLRATVSGSFHRHMAAVGEAVADLTDHGIKVLSPADPRIVDDIGGFLFVASDRVRAIKLVQDRHLECIEASDFLWLVTPDGYVGQSASMEIGFAVGRDVPVYSLSAPTDLTLQKYIHVVPSIRIAVALATRSQHAREPHPDPFLINPRASISVAHDTLAAMEKTLSQPAREINDPVGKRIDLQRAQLAWTLARASFRNSVKPRSESIILPHGLPGA